jgi:SAM-dependent methyltransferase
LRRKFPQGRFVVGDIRKTEFADEYFDACFSWGTFEHFEEGLGSCLREARRILKPDGWLFISVPFHNGRHQHGDRRDLWQLDKSFDKEKGYTAPMRFYQWRLTKSELWREFELNGFRTLRVEPIHKMQGVQRMVSHVLGIDRRSWLYKPVVALLCPFVSKNYVAHMILGIGCRLTG